LQSVDLLGGSTVSRERVGRIAGRNRLSCLWCCHLGSFWGATSDKTRRIDQAPYFSYFVCTLSLFNL